MGLGKTANQRLKPFFKVLGPDFDNYVPRGTMLIRRPVGMFMGGFQFEPWAGDPDRRWVDFFSCPLYILSNEITMDWGDRIPGPGPQNRGPRGLFIYGTKKEVAHTIGVMKDEGLTQLATILDLKGFYNYLHTWKYKGNQLPHCIYEALAYTAALLGFDDEVGDYLNRAEAPLLPANLTRPRDLYPMEAQLLARVRLIKEIYEKNGLSEVVSKLHEWRDASVRQFGLQDLEQAPSSRDRN